MIGSQSAVLALNPSKTVRCLHRRPRAGPTGGAELLLPVPESVMTYPVTFLPFSAPPSVRPCVSLHLLFCFFNYSVFLIFRNLSSPVFYHSSAQILGSLLPVFVCWYLWSTPAVFFMHHLVTTTRSFREVHFDIRFLDTGASTISSVRGTGFDPPVLRIL